MSKLCCNCDSTVKEVNDFPACWELELCHSGESTISSEILKWEVGSQKFDCRFVLSEYSQNDKYIPLSLELLPQPYFTKLRKMIRSTITIDVFTPYKPYSFLSVEQKSVFFTHNSTILFENCIKISQMKVDMHNRLADVTINCRFRIFEEIDQTHICTLQSMRGLAQQFGNIFANQAFSDIVIKVSGEETMKAHKCVLAARSAVFNVMFQQNMLETKQNIIEIYDIEREVLEELLAFIYTGKSKKLKEMAMELLIAADKYQIMDLKEECEFVLMSEISTTNVIQMIALADRHSAKDLKADAIRVLIANAKDIIKSEGFAAAISESNISVSLSDILTAITKNV